MFKLLNKKGFTLVELMIVVVILGILVGIAVPIYSVVTKNAEKKTCFSNMRMITSACVQYYMMHSSYEGLIPAAGIPDVHETTMPDEFVSKFDAVGIPKCPSGGAYKIVCNASDPEDTTVTVTCEAKGDFAGHGDYHPESN